MHQLSLRPTVTLSTLPILLGSYVFYKYALQALNFARFQWVHKSRIADFLVDDKTYAIITGASDGLGKCLAEQLYDRGVSLSRPENSPPAFPESD
jgi:hypothetical protein